MKQLLLILLLLGATQAKRLKIGVGLRPYYSFTVNIVGDRADVIPMTDGSNPHGYAVTPKDVKRALTLDVVVLNGIGHDDFVMKILNSAGIAKTLPIIYANDKVALIPQSVGSKSLNSHTFVSISTSIVQIYEIANKLADLDPENAQYFKDNAAKYALKLRRMKHEYMEKILTISDEDIHCATTHGGYSYLLQEFGITINEVIEPAHGMNPTATQLQDIISKIKNKSIDVIFSEEDYPGSFMKVLQEETAIVVVPLSHLSKGEYSAENFEKGMRFNLEQLLIAVKGRKGE